MELKPTDFNTLAAYTECVDSLRERGDENNVHDSDLVVTHRDNAARIQKEHAVKRAVRAVRRKNQPVYSGFVAYFPDAMIKVAELSLIANEQHHPGTPLHWDKAKSQDHNDCILRHMIDDVKGNKTDDDLIWHKTKVAWRAMAELQEECDRVAASPST